MISFLLILFKWIFARLKNVKAKDRGIIYLKVWWYKMIVFSKIVFLYLEFKVWWLHWICKVQVSFVDYSSMKAHALGDQH